MMVLNRGIRDENHIIAIWGVKLEQKLFFHVFWYHHRKCYKTFISIFFLLLQFEKLLFSRSSIFKITRFWLFRKFRLFGKIFKSLPPKLRVSPPLQKCSKFLKKKLFFENSEVKVVLNRGIRDENLFLRF